MRIIKKPFLLLIIVGLLLIHANSGTASAMAEFMFPSTITLNKYEPIELSDAILTKVGNHKEWYCSQEFIIEHLEQKDGWALATVACWPMNQIDPDVFAPLSVYFVIGFNDGGQWLIYLEGSPEFIKNIKLLPNDLISEENKQNFLNQPFNTDQGFTDLQAKSSTSIGLPWTPGTTWYYRQSIHGSNNALDLASACGTVGDIKAADSGTIFWKGDTCLIIRNQSTNLQVGYQHVSPSDVASWDIGDSVELHEFIGKTTLTPGCNGTTGAHHVHLWLAGINPNGYSFGGWVLNDPYLDKGSYHQFPNLSCNASNAIYYELVNVPPTKASNVRPNSWVGPYTSDNTPSFAWNPGSDSDSGMAGYYVAVDDWVPDGSTGSDWTVGNVTSFTIPNGSEIPDGEHIFAVTSRDTDDATNPPLRIGGVVNNNPGAAPYYTFYVDTQPPTGSFLINSGASTTPYTSVTIINNAADTVSGVAQMRVRNSGGTWGNWQPYQAIISHILPAVTGQSHTVEIQYQDKVGNISSTKTQNILLDIYPDRPTSTNYSILRSTVSSSPWKRQSGNYILHGTLGQPSPTGQSVSTNYLIESGYWSNIPPDITFPEVNSINRVDSNPTSASSVSFTVNFSEAVVNVDQSDFSLTISGITGGSTTNVSGSGATRTVTVNTGTGNGTIRLDIPASATITDNNGNALIGLPYISGETYTVNKSPTSPIFNDVPIGAFAQAQIEAIYNAGITGGCTTSPLNYCPNNTVNRAQMAIFLMRGIHGSAYAPPPATGTVFNDVPSNAFGAAFIEAFANQGITGGCGGGNYCPNNKVTRAQMAIFLLRAKYGSAYIPPPATGTMFSDVPSSHAFVDWIEQLANEGITGGCGNGNYCPNNPVTRAQMAIFLQRTFNLPLP